MTVYTATVKYTLTGHVSTLTYSSMTMRALQLIALAPYVTVLSESVEESAA